MGILLQNQINGFDEVYFTVGNIVTIVLGIVSILGFFFALKYGQKNNQNEIIGLKELHEKDMKAMEEKIINQKNGKIAIKKELEKKIEEIDKHNRARIDKTQEEMKQYKDKTDEEFKQINNSINEVKQNTANIIGKLDTLLGKN